MSESATSGSPHCSGDSLLLQQYRGCAVRAFIGDIWPLRPEDDRIDHPPVVPMGRYGAQEETLPGFAGTAFLVSNVRHDVAIAGTINLLQGPPVLPRN